MTLLSFILLSSCSFILIGAISSRYDNVDIETILSNERILSNYLKCVLDQGPCTEEGRMLKNDVPAEIKSGCSDCSEAQLRVVKKGVAFIMKNRPDDWQKIRDHFDPDNQYIDKFIAALNIQ